MVTYIIEINEDGFWNDYHLLVNCSEERAVAEVQKVRGKYPSDEFRLLVEGDAPLDERFVD